MLGRCALKRTKTDSTVVCLAIFQAGITAVSVANIPIAHNSEKKLAITRRPV